MIGMIWLPVGMEVDYEEKSKTFLPNSVRIGSYSDGEGVLTGASSGSLSSISWASNGKVFKVESKAAHSWKKRDRTGLGSKSLLLLNFPAHTITTLVDGVGERVGAIEGTGKAGVLDVGAVFSDSRTASIGQKNTTNTKTGTRIMSLTIITWFDSVMSKQNLPTGTRATRSAWSWRALTIYNTERPRVRLPCQYINVNYLEV